MGAPLPGPTPAGSMSGAGQTTGRPGCWVSPAPEGEGEEEEVGGGGSRGRVCSPSEQTPAMASLGLLLLLLLLAPRPLWPSSLPPPDTPEGKATIAGFILSALERATSFLQERLPEVNLDGVVGFRVLEGGCARSPGPAARKTSSQPVTCLLCTPGNWPPPDS